MTKTYENVFKQVKELFLKLDAGKVREHLAYQFHLTGEAEGVFYVEIRDGKLYAEPYEYYDRNAVFICSAETIINLLSGKEEFLSAVGQGKLRAEGNMEQALKLEAIFL